MLIKSSNIPILDSLRAFAALSVCLFHFVCTTSGYITNKYVLSFFSIGINGVQLFFVISGFVIPWAMFHAGFEFKNFFRFLMKRLARLEPPYVFSILLGLVVLVLKSKLLGVPINNLSLNQVLLHFGYLIPFFKNYDWLNVVYWSLAVEFQYYFFIAILFIPLIKSNLLIRILIYVFICLLSFIGGKVFLLYWLPAFFIGIVLFLFKTDLIKRNEYIITTILLLVLCGFKYALPSLSYILIPVVLVLFYPNLKIKILDFLGKMSYSIYLIHPVIGASFINVLSHSVKSDIGKVLVIISGVLLTLISAYVMYRIVEKPSKKLSTSITYKKDKI